MKSGMRFRATLTLSLVFAASYAYAQTRSPNTPLRESPGGAVVKARALASGLSTIPEAAESSISAALGKEDARYRVHAAGAEFRVQNAAQSLGADFTAQGVEVRNKSGRWHFALRGYGYGDELRSLQGTAPQSVANRVEYRRGGLTEWYVNGPAGLEQGFTLNSPPRLLGQRKDQPLTIALALSGNLAASLERDGRTLTLTTADGKPSLRYATLIAYDRSGRRLPAHLELHDNLLLLRVADTGAMYPVVVDPFVQEAKLTASDGAAHDNFAEATAISGDGGTIIVGAAGATITSNISQGAVYVFVKPSTGWAGNLIEAAKLTASDGTKGNGLGGAVAVSSDGSIVVAGADNADSVFGAAYVFVRPSTGWATTSSFAAKLTGTDSTSLDFFGVAVAISGDGGTVVVGSPQAQPAPTFNATGAAYVFVEPVGGWTGNLTQSAELLASDRQFNDGLGSWVNVSSEGTVIAGAISKTIAGNIEQGAAYIFAKPVAGWTGTLTETAELTAPGTTGFGGAATISADGGTVLTGAGTNAGDVAYVFLKPSGGWATTSSFAAKLIPSDTAEDDLFAVDSLAITDDGGRVLAGAPGALIEGNTLEGALYVFLRPSTGWSGNLNETVKLTASDGVALLTLGSSVGLSSDGSIAVGGAGATGGTAGRLGRVYVYQTAPLASVSPANLNFGNQQVGTTSNPQPVTLTNQGSTPLTLPLAITGVGASTPFGTSTNCIAASPLAAGASCTEQITFTPAAVGAANGMLTFTDNSANVLGSAQMVNLSGAGTDFTISASPSGETIPSGHDGVFTLTLTSLGGFIGNVGVTCAGGPPHSTCTISPNLLTLNGTSTAIATIELIPPKNVDHGTFTLVFTATPSGGGVSHSTPVSLKVK